jgi:hypothetical protein
VAVKFKRKWKNAPFLTTYKAGFAFKKKKKE